MYRYIIQDTFVPPRTLGVHNEDGRIFWFYSEYKAKLFESEQAAQDFARERLSEENTIEKRSVH